MNVRANYEVDTLESKIEVQINDAVKSIDTLVGSLKTLKSTLNDTIGSTNNNKLKNNIENSANSLKKVMNFSAVYIGLRKGWDIVKNISTEYTNMIETNNLFEVSMGKVVDEYGNLDTEASKYYTKAMAFQNEMNEKLLTNKAELKEYQAMYYSMLKSQGIDLNSSYLMSESLTKAGYDIASLYNLTVDDAMNKLKSGLAGQVEPLRAIGIDISESSLQKVLSDVGITDRSVQQLSYAEKEVARYIAILQQGRQAQGDFAKTMDSSANQIKIFQNQIAELKQVAGSFIVNTFGGVLVYVNAIIMVLKEILKAFANLFGYDLESSGTELEENVSGIDNGLSSAVNNAKELKKQLMGFDEINNITPNTTSASSSGVNAGIDSKLLEALDEWDNKMDSISGKAQEIRDRMLEWLGFERNDDGTWKLGEGYTNFEKILDIVKIIGTAFLGWKLGEIALKVSDIVKNLKNIKSNKDLALTIGISLLVTGITYTFDAIEELADGNANGETIKDALIGAVGIGLGATVLAGGSLAIGIPVAVTVMAVEAGAYIDSKIKLDEKIWKPLYEMFGYEYSDDISIANMKVRWSIGIDLVKLTWNNLTEKVTELWNSFKQAVSDTWTNLKNWFFEKLASLVEVIPVVGTKLAESIRECIEEEERNFQEVTTDTANNALLNSSIKIQGTATDLGKNIVQAEISGVNSQEDNIKNSLKTVGKKAIQKATPDISTTALNTGTTAGRSIGAGISSINLSRDVDTLTRTAKERMNSTSMFTEGKNLGATVKTGYSSNSLSHETSAIISTARKQITSTSLASEGRTLTNTINDGVNSSNFHRTGMYVVNGVTEGINDNSWKVADRVRSLANETNSTLNSHLDGYDSGEDYVNGINRGIKVKKWDLWDTVRGLAGDVMGWFKSKLGIHSPSREMAKIAQYIPLGIAKGIDDSSNEVFKSMNKISEGIKVNAEDFAINTNQFVDYGAIEGQVQAQANISVGGNFAGTVAQAVKEAMEETEVNVNIEAKTEKGIIFKTVKKEAEEFYTQTGKAPFPVT